MHKSEKVSKSYIHAPGMSGVQKKVEVLIKNVMCNGGLIILFKNNKILQCAWQIFPVLAYKLYICFLNMCNF